MCVVGTTTSPYSLDCLNVSSVSVGAGLDYAAALMMPFVYLHAATTRVRVSPQLLSFFPVITGHSTDSCVSRSGSLPSASSEDAGSVHSTQTLPATSRC